MAAAGGGKPPTLDEFKKELRSILLAHKQGLDRRSLVNYYLDFSGQDHFPKASELGVTPHHRSTDLLMAPDLSDTVVFMGHDPRSNLPVFKGVANEKTIANAQLVAQTKKRNERGGMASRPLFRPSAPPPVQRAPPQPQMQRPPPVSLRSGVYVGSIQLPRPPPVYLQQIPMFRPPPMMPMPAQVCAPNPVAQAPTRARASLNRPVHASTPPPSRVAPPPGFSPRTDEPSRDSVVSGVQETTAVAGLEDWRQSLARQVGGPNAQIVEQVYKLLNKLTAETFDNSVHYLSAMNINWATIGVQVVDVIFNKAVDDAHSCPLIAKLCHSQVNGELAKSKENKSTFRDLLLEKCCARFYEFPWELKHWVHAEEADEPMLWILTVESRKRMFGCFCFIGELYMEKMLPSHLIHHCIMTHWKRIAHDLENASIPVETVDSLEFTIHCMVKFLSIVGQILDNANTDMWYQTTSPEMLAKYCQYLEDERHKFSDRLRFAIDDLLHLQKNNWVPLDERNQPGAGPDDVAAYLAALEQPVKKQRSSPVLPDDMQFPPPPEPNNRPASPPIDLDAVIVGVLSETNDKGYSLLELLKKVNEKLGESKAIEIVELQEAVRSCPGVETDSTNVQMKSFVRLKKSVKSIPPCEQQTLPIDQQTAIEVCVTQFLRPNEFYAILTTNIGDLENLMNELKEHYEDKNDRPDLSVNAPDLKLNQIIYCAPWLTYGYHRIKVTNISDGDNIQVFFCDYGTTDRIPMKSVRYLLKELMKMPAQAIHCRLKGAVPPLNQGWDIPRIEEYFNEETAPGIMLREIEENDDKSYTADVTLKTGESLLNEYIDRGFARDSRQQQNQSHHPPDPMTRSSSSESWRSLEDELDNLQAGLNPLPAESVDSVTLTEINTSQHTPTSTTTQLRLSPLATAGVPYEPEVVVSQSSAKSKAPEPKQTPSDASGVEEASGGPAASSAGDEDSKEEIIGHISNVCHHVEMGVFSKEAANDFLEVVKIRRQALSDKYKLDKNYKLLMSRLQDLTDIDNAVKKLEKAMANMKL